MNDNKILHYYCDAGDKRKTSIVERFNKTMRLYLEKYRVIHGKITNAVITEILDAYNNVKHAGIKHTPIEILNDVNKQEDVEEHFLNLEQQTKLLPYMEGMFVRVKLDTNLFTKTKAIWSNEIYEIKKVEGSKYCLKGLDKSYPHDSLQAINPDFIMNY
jgi:predicted nucleic acid-binding protein